MLAIRKHFCWVYGLSAFVCLGFAVVLLLAIGSPQRLRLLPLHALAAVTMLVLAAVFFAAFWTTLNGRSSSRLWSLAASSIIILATLLPGIVTHQFAISSLPIFALGFCGILAAFLRPQAFAPKKIHEPLALPGDFTSGQINRVAQGLTLCISLGVWLWWQSWLRAEHIVAFNGFLIQLGISVFVLLAITLIHEFGHAVVGMLAGMKLRAFFIGPFQWRLSDAEWEFEFKPKGLLLVDGITALVPGKKGFDRRQYISMTAAGPAINVLAGGVACFIALRHVGGLPVQVNALIALIGAWSLGLAASNLLPFRTAGGYSDGAVVLQLLSDGAFADFHMSIARIGSSLVSSIRPRDYDIDTIQHAARCIGQGRQALLLWLHAFCHSLDTGKREEAGKVLENAEVICLASASNIPAELQTTLVFGNALVRHDPEGARFWWNRLQAQKPRHLNADYWRAASALHWIEGNLDDARRAWEKSSALAAQLPKAGAYDFSRDCCTLLRDELDRTAVAIPA